MTESRLSGAVADVVHHGSIGPIRSGGCEIIRRIFVTVRDKNWQEVAPQQWSTEVDRESGNVLISARHTNDLVDFAWRGELGISANGREIEFWFTGRVPKDMDVCRLGLVVLHPVDWMVGSLIFAEDAQSKTSSRLSSHIAPQPIVDGVPGAITQPFSALKIEHPGFGTLDLRFEGDLFELEDQRNWGDASFKTYCTPLRLGFPRSVKAGSVISHRVRVHFEPAREPISPSKPRLRTSTASVAKFFPRIGCADPDGRSVGPLWRHIQFRVPETDNNLARLELLLNAPFPTQLEIAFQMTEPEKLRRTLSLLSKHRRTVARFLVYSAIASVPTADELKRLQLVLNEFPALSDVPIHAATQGYFVEFNRAMPLSGSISGIAFPLTATVHSDDAGTIIDNVDTIHDMVDTARKLLPDSSIALAPLAFYHPPRGQTRQFPPDLARSWLVASLIEATLAGVHSITLGEDVVAEWSRSSVAGVEPSLSSLVECSGLEARRLVAGVPLGVHAIILKSDGNAAAKVLASNLSSRPQLLTLADAELPLQPFATGWTETRSSHPFAE